MNCFYREGSPGLSHLRASNHAMERFVNGSQEHCTWYTLSFMPLETRRVTQIPNTSSGFCREPVQVCVQRGMLNVWRGTFGIHHHHSHHLSSSASTTMAGPRKRCLRVLAHKSRLVSLKSVVRDIGRAYIKNRPRDERSPRIVASLPTFEDFSASSIIITVVRYYWRECTEHGKCNYNSSFRFEWEKETLANSKILINLEIVER